MTSTFLFAKRRKLESLPQFETLRAGNEEKEEENVLFVIFMAFEHFTPGSVRKVSSSESCNKCEFLPPTS